MAKQVTTITKCDIDGIPGASTERFGLGSHTYEIDLSAKRRRELEKALAPFIERATPVKPERPARRGPGRASSPDGRRGATVDKHQNAAIREWAIRKGLDVASRGRIKQEIVDQYQREAGR